MTISPVNTRLNRASAFELRSKTCAIDCVPESSANLAKAGHQVAIWNRTDPCCLIRLNDYWVFVSDTPFLPTDTPTTLQSRPATFSFHQTNGYPYPSTTIPVGAQGRYVRVQLSGVNYLSLAEVQVFGQ